MREYINFSGKMREIWRETTEIGDCAFSDCSSLTMVILPAGVRNMEYNV